MAALLRAAVLLAALGAGAATAQDDGAAPRRVVSMNLCTDQLAMLLAAPGQLVSISHVARDPRSSAMAAEAAHWPVNGGQAEEIFLLAPDLVLAGSFTEAPTVALLRRLGVEVVEFAPTASIAELRAGIMRMGALLGREAEARDMLARFDAGIAAEAMAPGPRAVLYYANGFTAAPGTLADEILTLGGFSNIAAEAGLVEGGVLALEQLLLARPDLVITGERYPGGSRAESLLGHPALAEMIGAQPVQVVADAAWVCGTPHVLDAISTLRAARIRIDSRR